MEMLSNVVNSNNLKKVYMNILDDLGNILEHSYGPFGSNTLIQKGPNAFPTYTKDGHTILSNVKYLNTIERSITSNILSITEYIVKNVGDGTTSAVLLADNILKGLIELQERYIEDNKHIPPVLIVDTFKKIVSKMCENIERRAKEFDVDAAYDISMISTNGNKDISSRISQIYKNLGNEVYINLSIANQKEDIIASYDGLVLETGLIEECYINDPEKKVSRLEHPHIYAFLDPVDTPEMIHLFESIIIKNIFDPIAQILEAENKPKSKKVFPPIFPTVILCPKLSRDASSIMERLTSNMSKMTGAGVRQRPPILILTNITSSDLDQYEDIIQMCGCPVIRKYINPEIQKKDQEIGLAPTYENVTSFFGTADVVEANHYRTTFINPQLMFTNVVDEQGQNVRLRSEKYTALVNFLETELVKAKEANADYKEIHHIKKRINSLKASYVDWYVGGVSASDRDQRYAAIEDAVKNCRSASRYGYGWGANFEGYIAINNIKNELGLSITDLEKDLCYIIEDAYQSTISILYESFTDDVEKRIQRMRDVDQIEDCTKPEGEKGLRVISSIKSDILVLEGIANLITIMATSNQYICPEPIDTTPYRADDRLRKEREAEYVRALNK